MSTGLDPLRTAIAVVALLVAGLHLYWGMPRYVGYTNLAIILQPDPRPIAFVVSGHLIVIGVTLGALRVIPVRPLYYGGIALAITYLLGYVAWHTVLGHGAFWPWGPGGHVHGNGTVSIIVQHLLADRFDLLTKVLELVWLGLLIFALIREDSVD